MDYLDKFRVRRQESSDDQPRTNRVYLHGPSEISCSGGDSRENAYKRVKLDDMQSKMLREAVKELRRDQFESIESHKNDIVGFPRYSVSLE